MPNDPRAALKSFMRAFVGFALEDTARCDLLVQRPIPGFEPSAWAHASAQALMAPMIEVLRATGVEDQDDIDCIVAMVAGLIRAQLSNDPGGDRWTRHLERLPALLRHDDGALAHCLQLVVLCAQDRVLLMRPLQFLLEITNASAQGGHFREQLVRTMFPRTYERLHTR